MSDRIEFKISEPCLPGGGVIDVKQDGDNNGNNETNNHGSNQGNPPPNRVAFFVILHPAAQKSVKIKGEDQGVNMVRYGGSPLSPNIGKVQNQNCLNDQEDDASNDADNRVGGEEALRNEEAGGSDTKIEKSLERPPSARFRALVTSS